MLEQTKSALEEATATTPSDEDKDKVNSRMVIQRLRSRQGKERVLYQ
jgi:hypothetical protein